MIDVERQTAALTWAATVDGRDAAGGIDLLVLRDGRIAHVWSFAGKRPFHY